ncbi:hypothetical protein ABW19_dt0206566 [Dactylella cylindrospora]|nr:hypothetical protein ABW19_dt0206566 [Dactylella cylindrospora]
MSTASATVASTPGQQSTSAKLEGELRLKKALEDFKQLLSPPELTGITATPSPNDESVKILTDELNNVNSKKLMKLGEKCRPFLQFIQQFSPALDVYVQADSTSVASLIWGSIRVLVQMASNYFDYFVKISDMLQRMGHICPTMEEIGEIFSEDLKLKDSIRVLYAICLEFCTKALRFLRKSGTKQFVKSIWKPFKHDFEDIVNELTERRQIINEQVVVAAESAQAIARQQALIYQKDGYLHRKFQVDQWNHTRDWRLREDLARKEREVDELLTKLSDYDHARAFLNARDRRHQDTGKSFFSVPQFKKWYSGTGGSLLWYQDIPGAGKTFLASAVIDYLFDNIGSSDNVLMYFFCDFRDAKSLEQRTLVSSLLRQIITFRRPLSSDLHSEIQNMLSNPQRQPDLQELQELFIRLVQQASLAYVVVDGIDELDNANRRAIWTCFDKMLKIPDSKCKLLILSRPEIDLPGLGERGDVISHQSVQKPELEAYVRDRLQELDNLKDYPPAFINEILRALTKGADGMFLWIKFQIDDIENEDGVDSIRKVIQNLPKGLNETYARILTKILQKGTAEKALLIFKWVSAALRPLTLTELQEAIAITTDDTYHAQIVDRMIKNPTLILRKCSNLVIFNERDKTVQFAHSTVQDFLQTHETAVNFPSLHLNPTSTQMDIRNACLTYLSLSDFEAQVARRIQPKAVQAPAHWVPTMLDPLSVPSRIARFCLNWYPKNDPLQPMALLKSGESGKPRVLRTFSQSFPLLDYVRYNWLHHCNDLGGDDLHKRCWQLLRMLLFEKALPFDHLPWADSEGVLGFAHLPDFTWAIMNGNLSVLTLIFDTMPAMERRKYLCREVGEEGEPPLHIASRLWSADFVGFLLKNGAEVGTTFNGTNALIVASANGRLSTVEKLLAAKAKVNAAPIGFIRTALQAAAGNGHFDVVGLLLGAGADVNAPPAKFCGRTALQAAVEGVHLNIVERLIAANADVGAAPAKYSGISTFSVAARDWHLDILERLLVAKTGINFYFTSHLRTAVQAAAEIGCVDILCRLPTIMLDTSYTDVKDMSLESLQELISSQHQPLAVRIPFALMIASTLFMPLQMQRLLWSQQKHAIRFRTTDTILEPVLCLPGESRDYGVNPQETVSPGIAIFKLGIVLLEILSWESFESHYHIRGHWGLPYTIPQSLSSKWAGDMDETTFDASRYYHVVKYCISGDAQLMRDWDDILLWEAICKNIIKPLNLIHSKYLSRSGE